MSWLHGIIHYVASYFVYFLGVIGAAILVAALAGRSVTGVARWLILSAFVIGSSTVLAYLASLLHYESPVLTHQRPPWPNSFPSHHALLAGVIVALVFLARPIWGLLLVPFAAVIDVALIVDRDHRIQDVIASNLVVIAMTVVAIWFGIPLLLRAQPLLDRFAREWVSLDRRTRSWVLGDERDRAGEGDRLGLVRERERNGAALDAGGDPNPAGIEQRSQRVERHG